MTTCTNTTPSNYVSQLPGQLNLEMVDDNDMTFSIDWNMDITDYTFEANIVPKGSDIEVPMTITIINPEEGKMNVTITEASISAIPPSVNRWYLNWTIDGLVRTVMSGALVLRSR